MTTQIQLSIQKLELAKGQDWTLRLRILAPERVELAANAIAGATALTLKPLGAARANGDKLLFGENTVVTLSAGAAAGAISLAVSALPGPLNSGDRGQLIRDLTGFTIGFEALTAGGDATPVISKTGVDVTLANQTGDDRGFVEIAGVAADTASLALGHYYAAAWRRNSGSSRPLAEFGLVISAKGFL